MVHRELRLSIRSLALGLVFLWFGSLWSATQNITEYQVKAAYLYNFLKFVEWPSRPGSENQTSFCIGVLGRDPFGKVLEDSLSGKTVSGKPVVLKRFARPGDAGGCHVLFVGSVERMNTPDVMKALKGKGLLTVGDDDRFIRDGGMVHFVLEKDSVGFEISLAAVAREHLTLSPRLLQLAVIVSENGSARSRE